MYKKRLDTEVKPLEAKLIAAKKAQAQADMAMDEVVKSERTLEGKLVSLSMSKR